MQTGELGWCESCEQYAGNDTSTGSGFECPYIGAYEIDRRRDGDTGEFIIEYAECCLWLYVTDFTSYLFELHVHYKNGIMLEAGGIQDQPAWYGEAMIAVERAINGEVNKAQKRRIEQSKKTGMKF